MVFLGNPGYYTIYYKVLSLQDVPVSFSSTRDSLKVLLHGRQLRSLPFFYTADYKDDFEPRDESLSDASSIVDIPDSAFVSLVLVGTFPLGVKIIDQRKKEFITIDVSSKILKLSGQTSEQNLSLPCFDLLGRRHNLEFLGTDGSASTYSVRSLRAGVYFVSDGKEMVKFLIPE
jgi:hypothetical protein